MNCPVCGKEMEKGYVQTSCGLTWVKQKRVISLFPQEGSINLPGSTFSGLAVDAFVCRTCKKMVVDYAETKSKEK